MLARDSLGYPMQMNLRSRVWNHNYTMSEEYWRFRNGTSNAAGEEAKGYIWRSNDVSMNIPWSCGCISTNCKSTLF
jgi:hypothetical protein